MQGGPGAPPPPPMPPPLPNPGGGPAKSGGPPPPPPPPPPPGGMGGPPPPPPPPIPGFKAPPPPPMGGFAPPKPPDLLPYGLKPKKKWEVEGTKRLNWKTVSKWVNRWYRWYRVIANGDFFLLDRAAKTIGKIVLG